MTNETLSIKAAADLFGLTRVTVYRAIYRGDLRCRIHQISGVVVNRIDPQEAATWARALLTARLKKYGTLTKKQRLGLRRAKELNRDE